MLSTSSHRFRLLGRGTHPVVDSAADLSRLPELDDAHWVATAAPIATLRGDPAFYRALDRDADGRIRSDDVRAATTWLFEHLDAPDAVEQGHTTLRREALRVDATDHARLLRAFGHVAGQVEEVGLESVRKTIAEEEAKGLSAKGRVLPTAAGRDDVREMLEAVVTATGGVPHPSGEAAVDRDTLTAYGEALRGWLAWEALGAAEATRPLGEATGAAADAVEAVAAKVAQYFLLCDAVALDPNLAPATRVQAADADLLEPTAAQELLARAPVAPPRPEPVLRLDDALNPAFRAAIERLFSAAAQPLLGAGEALSRDAWRQLQERLAPFVAWREATPAIASSGLDLDAVRGHVTDTDRLAEVDALLQASVAGAVAVDSLRLLERLVLLQAHLLRFANNFVALPELMSADAKGLMEQGRLVMDGRVFDLALRVTDPARAETFGKMSPIFVMYVKVGAKAGEWTDELAVPVTAGERGHLVEGKWGVFFPTEGGELHAQVRAIASSPISIKEAVFAPFRTLSKAIQAAADKAATSKTSAMEASVSEAGSEVAQTAQVPAPPAEAAQPSAEAGAPSSSWAGQLPLLLAGAGIALAAVGSSLAYVVDVVSQAAGSLASAMLGMGLHLMLPTSAQGVAVVLALPLALLLLLVGLLVVPFLIYAIPVAFATWLRLRQRDLGVILEGAGWAVNERLMLERSHAVRLTRRPLVSPRDLTR